jgi:hypothetical protein
VKAKIEAAKPKKLTFKADTKAFYRKEECDSDPENNRRHLYNDNSSGTDSEGEKEQKQFYKQKMNS